MTAPLTFDEWIGSANQLTLADAPDAFSLLDEAGWDGVDEALVYCDGAMIGLRGGSFIVITERGEAVFGNQQLAEGHLWRMHSGPEWE